MTPDMKELPAELGALPSDRAFAVPVQPFGLAPSGFDPSRISSFDETDWHVLAQDISNFWSAPEDRAIAYQAAAEAIRLLRLERARP